MERTLPSKSIGIDGRALPSKSGGVYTYVKSLLKYIPALDALSSHFPSNNMLWNLTRVPVTAVTRKWKLYHAPSYTCPLLCPCPIVLSVHDISYLVKDDWYPYRTGRTRRGYYRASLRKADRILVPSDFTRQEVIRENSSLESKLRLVPLAVAKEFYPDRTAADRVVSKYRLTDRFFLHVGDIHPRRNIEQLDRLALETGTRLVLVGRKMMPIEFKSPVVHLQSISIDELRGLYSAAELFVYASVYEGFGLPLLEAMACGLPVVAYNCASVPEVCGDAGVLVEPGYENLTEGVETALKNRESIVDQVIKRASIFSWRDTARMTSEIYRELIGLQEREGLDVRRTRKPVD